MISSTQKTVVGIAKARALTIVAFTVEVPPRQTVKTESPETSARSVIPGKTMEASHSESEAMTEQAERALSGGKSYPLYSKRLNASHLQLLAGALGLPTTASPDETRQNLMIDGRLADMEREPQNVQVVVQETEVCGTEVRLLLLGESGVFRETESYLEPVEPRVLNRMRDSRLRKLGVSLRRCKERLATLLQHEKGEFF